MARQKRYNRKKDLLKVPVFIEETGITSKYFQIYDVPEELPMGKSSFLIGGSQLLVPQIKLQIEIIDSKSGVIYTQPVFGYTEGTSKRIAIEVYEDTPPGRCQLVVLGEIDSSKVDFNIPAEFRGKYNLRYTRDLSVNLTIPNTLPIRFYRTPKATIQANSKGVIELDVKPTDTVTLTGIGKPKSHVTSETPITNIDGSITYPGIDSRTKNIRAIIEQNKASSKEGGGGNYLTIPPTQQDPPGDYTLSLSSTVKAEVSMIGQDVLINSPSVDYSNSEISSEDSYLYEVPSAFSSSVLDVTDENTITLLDSFYVTKRGEEPPTKIPAALEPVSITATRQVEPTGSESTFNFFDVADMLLTDLRNFSGDVNKVRIFTRSDAAQNPSQWNFIKEIFLEAKEELYDTGSLLRSGNMGYFITQEKIDDHWQGYSGEFGGTSGGAISLLRDNSKIMNAMDISGSNRPYQHDLLVQSKKPMSLQKNVRYAASMKIYGDAKSKLKGATTDTTKGKLQIFISGSGIPANTDLPSNYGRLIGNLELPSDESNGQGSFNFDLVDAAYISRVETNAFLQLRMPSGRWKVAEVSVKPSTSTNFSPDIFKCYAELPVAQQRPDFYQFLIEFYDVNNNKADTTALSDRIKFDGANLTIQGEDNLLSGSMFIGGSLLSGIEAGGRSSAFIRSLGYFGFDKAESIASGGFMFWSGSVIPDHETYDGVGIELHNDSTKASGDDSYLQFRTKDKSGNSLFRVKTNEFFFGNEGQHISGSGGNIQISSSKFFLGSDTQYVSGSDGNIEISSSNFHLTADGDVTMSGAITADAGYIAGWQIVGDTLSGSNVTLDAAGAGLYKSDAGPDAYPMSGYYIDFTPGTNYYIRMGSHFAVSSSGVLIASGAKIEGQLTASSGLIANWNIGDHAIYKYTTSNTWTGMSSTGDARFFAGAITLAASSSAPFNVKESGEVTASSGLIGGWSLSSNSLISPNSRMTMSADPGNERITVRKSTGSAADTNFEMVRIGEISDAAGDRYGIKVYDGTGVYNDDTKQGQVVLLGEQGNMIGGWEITDTQIRSIPDAGFGGQYYEGESGLIIHSSGRLESADFASNLKGWRIDSLGNGTAEFENCRIRGTLSTAVFEKESVNVVGGQLMVANASAMGALKSGSIIIAGSETASASDVTMSMDNVSGFAKGEIIKAKLVGETGFSVEYLQVTGSMRFSEPSSSVSASLAGYDLGAIDPDGLAGEIYVGRAFGGIVNVSSSVSTITEAMTQSSISGSTERITVASSASFATQQIIKIDDERMKIVQADGLNAPSGSGVANTMVVLRDYHDTGNMAHADDSTVWAIDTDKEFLAGLISTASPYNAGQVFVSTGRFDSGSRGSGYILMNANPSDMSTPYIDIVERTGSGVYDLSLKTRLGDLSGLSSGYLYGDDEPGFGIYTENGFFSGAITAQTGSFAGVVHVATVQGGLETGEKISIGRQVYQTNDGIFINNNNYWYTTGAWKVGGGTNYLSLDNATAGNIDIRSETFNLSTSKLLLRSAQNNGMLSLGSTPNLDVSGSNAGVYMDGTGDFLLYGNATNYFKKDGTDIDIKAETFDLATSRMVLDSTATGSGRIALGVSPPGSITSGEGFYADGVGNFLLGAAAGDHLSWDAATSTLTIKGVIRQNSAGTTLTDFIDRGTWAHTTAYIVNDLVQYTVGETVSTYKCVGAHTSTNDANATTGTPNYATNSWDVYVQGTAGVAGADAKTTVVSAESLVFVKAQDGTYTPTGSTLLANNQNTTADGAWSTSAGTLSSTVNTHTAASTHVLSSQFADGMVVTYTLHGDDGSITDTATLKELDEGSGTVQAILSNQAHVFPATFAGAVSSYAGSGTTIRVYEGATELTFVTGTPAAGEWKVVVGDTADITEGSITDSGTYCTIAAHSGAATGTDQYVITYTISGKTANGTTFTTFTQDQSLSKSKEGDEGDDGANAKTVVVNANSLVFVKAQAGTLTPATITMTANNQNTTADGAWSTSAGTLTSTVNTHTNASTVVTSANFVDGMVVTYTLHSNDGSVTDAVTLKELDEGSGTVQAILSNSAHVFPAASNGAVSSYAGSGTTIKVYEGATAMTFTTGTLAAGEFAVSLADTSNITEGTLSGNGTATCTVADHSGAANGTDEYVMTYTITGKTANGTTFTSFTQIQSLSKSKSGADGSSGSAGADARAVSVTMAAQSFAYNTAGTTPSPSSTTVTATALNTTGTPYYEFIVDGSSDQNSTTATHTYTPDAAYSNMPEDILVKLREGATDSTVLARDQITVLGLKAGSDAATIMLTNEAHTLPTDNGGTVTYTGAGTDIKAWSGTTALSYAASGANTFSVVVASDTNITVGAASTVSTYTRRFADHSDMDANTANIVYTVTVRDSSAVATAFSKTQTFAKSIEGGDGAAAASLQISSDSQVFALDDSTDTSLSPTYVTVTATQQNQASNLVDGDLAVDNSSAKSNFSYSAGSGTGTGTATWRVTPDGYESGDFPIIATVSNDSLTDKVTLHRIIGGLDGTTAKTITLSAEGNVFIEDINGDLSPASIKFTVNKQNTSAAVAWTASPSVTFYTAASGGSTTTSANPMYLRKGDYGANTNVLVTATCDSIVDTARVVRLVEGSGAVNAVLSNGAHVFQANSVGAVSSYADSGTQIRCYEGANELTYDGTGTADGTWKAVVTTDTNITAGAISDSGDYATVAVHSAVANGTDESSILYTITGTTENGTTFTITQSQSFSKSKAAAPGITVILSNETHTFQGDLNGAVTAYDNSGTTITVYEGTSLVAYDGTGTSTSTFKTTPTATACTAGAGSDSGTYVTYANVTAVTTNSTTSKISFLIEGTDSEGSTFTATKLQTFAISKTGQTGTSTTGADGAGVVYRGVYASGNAYIHDANRKDVVKYGSNWYVTNNTGKSGGTSWGTPGVADWSAFGAQFTSVATDLLFAQEAVVGNTLTIGTDSDSNTGILRSATATDATHGTGFYMNHAGLAWLGNVEGSYIGISTSGVVTAAGFTITSTYLTSAVAKDAYTSAEAGVFLGTAGIGLGTGQFTVSAAGALHAVSGDIGGWTMADGYLYGLGNSSTPTSNPEDGLVLKAGATPVITAYENTQKRVELGYLGTSGIFGIRGYADNGSDVTFELSDTQTSLAGWNFTKNKLSKQNLVAGSSDGESAIAIDAGNSQIAFYTGTYGSADSDTGHYMSASIVTEINADIDWTDESSAYTNTRDKHIAWSGNTVNVDTLNTGTVDDLFYLYRGNTTDNTALVSSTTQPTDQNLLWEALEGTAPTPGDEAIRMAITTRIVANNEAGGGGTVVKGQARVEKMFVYNGNHEIIATVPYGHNEGIYVAGGAAAFDESQTSYWTFTLPTTTTPGNDQRFYIVLDYNATILLGDGDITLSITNLSVQTWDTKTVLSQKGLQVMNGPYQNVRIGSGEFRTEGSVNVIHNENVGGHLNVSQYVTIGSDKVLQKALNKEYNLYVGNAYATGSEGSIGTVGNIIAYVSDKRLKDDLKYIENPIEKIKQIGGYNFTWGTGSVKPGKEDVGVISQEVEEIMPEVIRNWTHTIEDVKRGATAGTFKSVLYDRMVPLLIEGIKEQQDQIDYLKEQLNTIVCGSFEPQ